MIRWLVLNNYSNKFPEEAKNPWLKEYDIIDFETENQISFKDK